jgi:hypothetical protein
MGAGYGTTTTSKLVSLGCTNGHGAFVFLDCSGSGQGFGVSGTVRLALSSSCDSQNAQMGDSFTYTDLAPGMSSKRTLQDCATFQTFCASNNACAFNMASADITVSNSPN